MSQPPFEPGQFRRAGGLPPVDGLASVVAAGRQRRRRAVAGAGSAVAVLVVATVVGTSALGHTGGTHATASSTAASGSLPTAAQQPASPGPSPGFRANAQASAPAVSGAAGLAAGAAPASGGTVVAGGVTGTTLSPGGPVAEPTAAACSINSASDLEGAVGGSARLVQVTVTSAPVTEPAPSAPAPGDSTDLYHFASAQLLLDPGRTIGPLSVNTEDAALVQGARYVLALLPVTGSDTPANSFVVSDGLLGRFLVSPAGTVSGECPNDQNPSHPLVAAGSGMSLARFTSLVRAAVAEAARAQPPVPASVATPPH